MRRWRRAGDSAAAPAKIPVFAGIPPLAWLVQRIGGPWVEVGVLVSPGQNPHVFQPSPRQVVAVKKAALFFKIGMPFESRLVELLQSRTSGPRWSMPPTGSTSGGWPTSARTSRGGRTP